MPKYRLQKNIDTTLETDQDGEFRIRYVLGLSGAFGNFVQPTDLEAAGWTVTKELTPDEEPVGTVRRFVISGDLIVKSGDGEWRYITHSFGSDIGGRVGSKTLDGYSSTELVVTG